MVVRIPKPAYLQFAHPNSFSMSKHSNGLITMLGSSYLALNPFSKHFPIEDFHFTLTTIQEQFHDQGPPPRLVGQQPCPLAGQGLRCVISWVPWAWDLGNHGITGQPKEKQGLSKLSSQLHAFFLGDRPPPRPGTEDDQQKTLIHLSGSFDFAAKFFQIKSILF